MTSYFLHKKWTKYTLKVNTYAFSLVECLSQDAIQKDLSHFVIQFSQFIIVFNPIPSRLCHVMYYHGNKKYPCLVGIGLSGLLQKILPRAYLLLCTRNLKK